MHRKRLIILVILAAILVLGSVGYSKRHTFFPSQQMQALRQLEHHLDLPTPKYRDEEDLGNSKDLKGAVHYSRHIALSYEDASVLDTMRTKLLNDSWQEQHVDPVGPLKYFQFKKGVGATMQCIGGYTEPKGDDGITLYIALEASGEYSCNSAL